MMPWIGSKSARLGGKVPTFLLSFRLWLLLETWSRLVPPCYASARRDAVAIGIHGCSSSCQTASLTLARRRRPPSHVWSHIL